MKKSNRNNPSWKQKILTIRPVIKIIKFIVNHLNLSYTQLYNLRIYQNNFHQFYYSLLSLVLYLCVQLCLKNKKKVGWGQQRFKWTFQSRSLILLEILWQVIYVIQFGLHWYFTVHGRHFWIGFGIQCRSRSQSMQIHFYLFFS